MFTNKDGVPWECVLIDLNTQMDFCYPEGADPVANLDSLLPALRRIVAWGKRNGVPFVSSVHSHRRRDLWCDGHPAHCIDGTTGQRKLPFTLFHSRVHVEFDNTVGISLDLFRRAQQVLFRKRTVDLLGNPKADRFLTQLKTNEFIIYGVGIECAVKSLALGLIAREKPVTVVVDASGYWKWDAADFALRQIQAKGAKVITVNELTARCLTRRVRFPRIALESTFELPHPDGNGAAGNGAAHTNGSRKNGVKRNGHTAEGCFGLSSDEAITRIPPFHSTVDGRDTTLE